MVSQLQNSVSADLRSDAIGYAVSRPTGCKTAIFSGKNCKTEVLQFPLVSAALVHLDYQGPQFVRYMDITDRDLRRQG
jgi:hypothetical protein